MGLSLLTKAPACRGQSSQLKSKLSESQQQPCVVYDNEQQEVNGEKGVKKKTDLKKGGRTAGQEGHFKQRTTTEETKHKRSCHV